RGNAASRDASAARAIDLAIPGPLAFGVTDVPFAMGRRRLRRSLPARVTIKKILIRARLEAHASKSASAPVVHGDCAVSERLRREQLGPPRAGQPTLEQSRAVA